MMDSAASPAGAATRASYGVDAPGVMAGLLAAGAGGVAAGLALARLVGGPVAGWAGGLLATLALVPLLFGLLMLVYWLAGKRRTRDLLLGRLPWAGDEVVLDVGTGAGFLAVAAARRAPRGRIIGVDLWAAKDLSGNGPERARRNALIEGVADRVEVRTDDARALDLPDASVDRVVSLLCLHNIEPEADRRRACAEIGRVLRPGGWVAVGDYLPVGLYANAFRAAGLVVDEQRTAFGTALSLMWIVVARKP